MLKTESENGLFAIIIIFRADSQCHERQHKRIARRHTFYVQICRQKYGKIYKDVQKRISVDALILLLTEELSSDSVSV